MHFWFLMFRERSCLMESEGGGNKGGGTDGSADDGDNKGGSDDKSADGGGGTQKSKSEQDTYSADYVRALREEARSYRLELKDAKTKLAAATGSAERVAALEAQVRDLTVGTAVETALRTAGAISPDLIIKAGVIDLAKVELGADGKPDGAKLTAAIEEIKKSRGELFGAPKRPDVDAGAKGSSSSGQTMNDMIRRAAGH